MLVPTGREMTSAVPGGSSDKLPTRGKGLPHSEHPSERAVVERAIDPMRDVPGLVRRQDTASTDSQGSAGRVHYCATAFIGQEGVETQERMSCRAGAGVGSERGASV